MTPRRLRRLASTAIVLMAGSLAAGETAAASRVAITDLDDVSLGRWSGRGDLVAEDEHCVRVTGGPKPRVFRLEAYGPGAGGAFVLRNGRNSLPFEVAYDDGRGFRTFASPGSALSGLRGSETGGDYQRCRRGDPSERKRIRIRVTESDLTEAPAGRFGGRLLLMVVPE